MLATPLAEESPTTATSPSQTRRFLRALAITNLVLVLPAFWLTFVDWRDHVTLFPRNPQGDVYDLQTRALLSGHLNVPTGSLGVEGFIHDGQTYTYFGLFPSLMRLPILMVTHSLDGRLTAMSLFFAWIATTIRKATSKECDPDFVLIKKWVVPLAVIGILDLFLLVILTVCLAGWLIALPALRDCIVIGNCR